MSSSIFFFCFITLLPAAAAGPDTSTSCHPSDLAALRSIAAAFPAPLFNHNNTHMEPWSHWTTVTCSGGRVTGLKVVLPFFPISSTPFPSALCTGLPALTSLVISGGPLSGSLPLCSSTGHNLTKLLHLDLSVNDLTGPLTSPLHPFPPSLRHLNLSHNGLTGPIPAHFLPPSLRHMDLSYNFGLTGPIPHSLSLLQSLQYLDLSDNGLTGPIPAHFLPPSLRHLDLSGNFGLTGPIPHNLSLLQSLQYLDLSGNIGLTGPIPAHFLPPSLRHLDLSHNIGLTGPIPHSLSLLQSLQYLDLSDNGLTGPIPHSLSLLQSLQYLDLSGNIGLTGPIPHSLSLLQSLQYLDLSGTFPPFLANSSVFPHLETLHLSSNYFLSGPLPTAFSFPNLTSLYLSYNAFSGPLPTFNAPALQYLGLSGNRLSGSLSPLFQYSNLTSLKVLRLDGNYLSGTIQDFHPSHFSDLSELFLGSNSFTGAPPNSICKLSQLSHLDLSGNSFSGKFHMPQCNLTQLLELHISHNNFTGPFPDWLGSQQSLEKLHLEDNHFSGSLPNSWRNLTSLGDLALSGNSVILPDNNHPHEPKLPKWIFNISSLSLSSMQLEGKDLRFCSNDNGVGPQDLDLSLNDITMDPITGFDPLACLSIKNLTQTSLNLSGNPLRLNLSDPNAVKLLPLQIPDGALDLSSCMLVGRLTSLFFDRLAPSFSGLYLSHNQLEGQIPQGLGNMSYLQALDLSYNRFTGFAPLYNMGSRLKLLDLSLSNNDLGGDLQSMLSNIIGNISYCIIFGLDLSHNHLTGAIPPFLGQCLTFSVKLRLNHNHLESFIPNELLNPTQGESNLQILSLGNNNLSGEIPASFNSLKQLLLLDLSHNRLEGILESSALFKDASSAQYAHLRILDLGYNRFTGTIPTSLGDIAPSLQLIDLSNNNFTGSIPSHVLESLPQFRIQNQLQGLDISKGSLYEEISITVKDTQQAFNYVIAALTLLDLSHNKLSGEISNIGLGKLSGLVYLNLSSNNFSGPLPSDLGNLGRQLESMDLSFNKLCGPIPSSFQNLSKLAVFNVSYNEGLVGPIPQNSPQFENSMSYLGDAGLCGQPVLQACDNIPNHAEPQNITSNTTLSWFDEWISIPGLCLGFVIGFPGFLYIFKALGLHL